VKYYKVIHVLGTTKKTDMKRLLISFFMLLLIAAACKWSKPRLDIDVSHIPLEEVNIHRYDLALFDIPLDQLPEGLDKIKPEFLFFLDTDLTDSAKINSLTAYLTHMRTIEFYQEVARKYPDLPLLEGELTEAFRHLKYYYPDIRIPRVYTYISGGEYDMPVQFIDSVLLIALDSYLGAGFKPYAADRIPVYRMQRMGAENILPDCIRAMQESLYPVRYPGNTLLDQMVDAGKRVYLIDAMIPGYPDRYKIGYTENQLDWVITNEEQVWAAIIENQFLYSSYGSTIRAFLADGPFTADFSAESPPRLGEYLGWQIVAAYMEQNPEITLEELINEPDAQKILTGSKYKPKK